MALFPSLTAVEVADHVKNVNASIERMIRNHTFSFCVQLIGFFEAHPNAVLFFQPKTINRDTEKPVAIFGFRVDHEAIHALATDNSFDFGIDKHSDFFHILQNGLLRYDLDNRLQELRFEMASKEYHKINFLNTTLPYRVDRLILDHLTPDTLSPFFNSVENPNISHKDRPADVCWHSFFEPRHDGENKLPTLGKFDLPALFHSLQRHFSDCEVSASTPPFSDLIPLFEQHKLLDGSTQPETIRHKRAL
jgi:hypothetical protein